MIVQRLTQIDVLNCRIRAWDLVGHAPALFPLQSQADSSANWSTQ